jgi:hypothetical protein
MGRNRRNEAEGERHKMEEPYRVWTKGDREIREGNRGEDKKGDAKRGRYRGKDRHNTQRERETEREIDRWGKKGDKGVAKGKKQNLERKMLG